MNNLFKIILVTVLFPLMCAAKEQYTMVKGTYVRDKQVFGFKSRDSLDGLYNATAAQLGIAGQRVWNETDNGRRIVVLQPNATIWFNSEKSEMYLDGCKNRITLVESNQEQVVENYVGDNQQVSAGFDWDRGFDLLERAADVGLSIWEQSSYRGGGDYGYAFQPVGLVEYRPRHRPNNRRDNCKPCPKPRRPQPKPRPRPRPRPIVINNRNVNNNHNHIHINNGGGNNNPNPNPEDCPPASPSQSQNGSGSVYSDPDGDGFANTPARARKNQKGNKGGAGQGLRMQVKNDSDREKAIAIFKAKLKGKGNDARSRAIAQFKAKHSGGKSSLRKGKPRQKQVSQSNGRGRHDRNVRSNDNRRDNRHRLSDRGGRSERSQGRRSGGGGGSGKKSGGKKSR